MGMSIKKAPQPWRDCGVIIQTDDHENTYIISHEYMVSRGTQHQTERGSR